MLMLLSVHVKSVLFLVQFNNFALTMDFYWSYTLLLKLPFLCALVVAIKRNPCSHFLVEVGVCDDSAAVVEVVEECVVGGVAISCLGVASILRGTSLRVFIWCMTPSRWKYMTKMSGSFCMRTAAICIAPTTTW